MTTATLSDFRAHTGRHLARMRRTGEPEVVTRNGKPAYVAMTPEQYEAMARLADRAETIEMIRIGATQADAGQLRSHQEVFAGIAKQCGIKYPR